MDSNKFSAQIERFEVVETGRRRRWTDDEKLKIVLSLQTPRAVSSTARRYGISRSLLLTWRRSFGNRASTTEQPQPAFVPAMVTPDPPPARTTVLAKPASGSNALPNSLRGPSPWPLSLAGRSERALYGARWPAGQAKVAGRMPGHSGVVDLSQPPALVSH
jgi:transposase